MKLKFLTAFILSSICCNAQSLWTSAGAKYDFLKNFSVNPEVEYRTNNKFSGTERWTAGLSLDYKVIAYLKLDAGYKYISRHVEERITSKGNIVEDYWQPRHRAYFSVAGQFKWHRFTFSLRERYQFTHHKSMWVKKTSESGSPKDDEFIDSKNKNILRSRLKIDYSIRKSGFKPFISAEVYNNINGFHYSKTRLTAGTEFKINRHNSVEAFYRYIDRSDSDENGGHIIGIGYQYKF